MKFEEIFLEQNKKWIMKYLIRSIIIFNFWVQPARPKLAKKPDFSLTLVKSCDNQELFVLSMFLV